MSGLDKSFLDAKCMNHKIRKFDKLNFRISNFSLSKETFRKKKKKKEPTKR